MGGNPVTYTDPYGLWATAAVGIGIRVVGGRAAAAAIGAGARNALGPAGGVAVCLLAGICDFSDEDSESKPDNCPSGTMPIDKAKKKLGLGKDDVHGIKEGVGAGPRTWTGVDPKGNVWTGGPGGVGENNGPYEDYLP